MASEEELSLEQGEARGERRRAQDPEVRHSNAPGGRSARLRGRPHRADFVVIKATLRRPAGLAGWKSLQEWAL